MSVSTEQISVKLFDECLHDLIVGSAKPFTEYLERCPASGRGQLIEALEGAAFLVANVYQPPIIQGKLNSVYLEIRDRRKAKLARRAAVSRAKDDVVGIIRDPAAYLKSLFDFTQPIVPSIDKSLTTVGVFNRGSSSTQWGADEAHLWLLERELAPKAERILRELELLETPVDLNRVAEGLGIYVEDASLPEGIDGCLATDGVLGGILLNRLIADSRRRRFTLAHEIAHYVLHRREVRFLAEGASDVGTFAGSVRERQADVFASFLLIPPSLLSVGTRGEQPSLEAADEIAQRFDVSFLVALRRQVRESHWRCAFVVTRDGVVQQSVRSRGFNGFVRHGSKPHRDTAARQLLEPPFATEDFTRTPASHWLEGDLVDEDVELREQSRRLGKNYVYSLICVIE